MFAIPVSASSSICSRSVCVSLIRTMSSFVCGISGLLGGMGAGSSGNGTSSASRNVDTTA
jgi:hypothetical protein